MMGIYVSHPYVVSCAGFGLEPLYSAVIGGDAFRRTGFTLQHLMDASVDGIRDTVDFAIRKYGRKRIAVLVGSCDNGTDCSLPAHRKYFKDGAFPPEYSFWFQKASVPAEYVKKALGLDGLAATCTTACASSSSAIVKGCQLLKAGFCDAVVAGGVDIASGVVNSGFGALEAISAAHTNPFSKNRDGITLGDGVAFFVLTRDDIWDTGIQILGYGESSDASHITAPDESGEGALASMQKALKSALLEPSDIDYINLHGTGTKLNDLMEAKAVDAIFGGKRPPVSSTKPVTGHTLGAAGAIELAICYSVLVMGGGWLPVHCWDGQVDELLPKLDFVEKEKKYGKIKICMSNTFAFGGCNVCLIIGDRKDDN